MRVQRVHDPRPSRHLFLVFLPVLFLIGCSRSITDNDKARVKTAAVDTTSPGGHSGATWNKVSAAKYLNQREAWWMQWEAAKRDQNTFCVSCHTNLPFVFAQPVLRNLTMQANSDNNEKIINDVRERVRYWNSVGPYYGDKQDGPGNGAGSRATEAVLNALILAYEDSQSGRLSNDTRAALQNMWSLQISAGSKRGAWNWQNFRLSPWESTDSPYFGATLASLAVGVAPQSYSSQADIQTHLALLRQYLLRDYSQQSLLNRAGLLWASAHWPGLLTDDQRRAIIDKIAEKQNGDGGWSLSSLLWSPKYFGIPSLFAMWHRDDGTSQVSESDGLATGYLAFVFEESGLSSSDSHLQNGLLWLARNQNANEGCWTAYSLNKNRDPSSNVGKFMTDAATAFALLALDTRDSPAQGRQCSGTTPALN